MTYAPRGRHFEEFAAGETFTTAARSVRRLVAVARAGT